PAPRVDPADGSCPSRPLRHRDRIQQDGAALHVGVARLRYVTLYGGHVGVGAPLVVAGVDLATDVGELGDFRRRVDGEVEDVVLEGGADPPGGAAQVRVEQRATEVGEGVAAGIVPSPLEVSA